MKTHRTPWVRLYCSASDGRSEEYMFPSTAIEDSRTACRNEVLGFRSRLEVAREVTNLSPGVKSAFTKRFHAAVIQAALLFIVVEALKVLIQKLRAAGDQPLKSVLDFCAKYPYLKVSPQSPDRSAIDLVEDAICPEEMAARVRKLIGGPLESVFPPEKITDWGMAHLLAWTLEDFAYREDLRFELLGLTPGQADKLIWSRAWVGEEFRGRFAQAVIYLGSELARFVVEAIDLRNMTLNKIETLLGLRSSEYYLSIASGAKHGSHSILQWATTQYAGLESSDALAVAEALRNEVWRTFSDERARRRFVFEESRRKSQEFDFIVLNSAGGLPGTASCGVDDWNRCRLDALAAGQDAMTAVNEIVLSRVAVGVRDFEATDALLLFRRAIANTDLTLDAQRVVYARLQGYTRAEAHLPFQITENRASAGFRDLNRKKSNFCRFLRP